MKRQYLPPLALILAGAFYVQLSSRQRPCTPCAVLAARMADDTKSPGPSCKISAPETLAAQSSPTEKPPAFAAFVDWTARWTFSDQSQRKAMLPEGLVLAQERRRRMADMILADPQKALQLAVPYAVRKSLPAEMASLMEEQVNAIGSLRVAGVMPLPGTETDTPPSVRWAESGGRVFQVATFGEGMNFVTKKRAPLNGIALPAEAATNFPTNPAVRPDMIMALDPNPARELEAEEITDRLAVKKETCPTSGDKVTAHGTPGLVEVGGEIHSFCGPAHMREWAANAVQEAALTTPDPDYPVMASGGAGEVAAAGLPVAASGYTEGYKRLLFLRPRFSDSSSALADTISDAAATTLMNNFIAHMNNMSWGRLKIAPLGTGGSQFTSALVMGRTASSYDNAGLSTLYPEARTAAQNAGYNLGDYAFAAVFTGGRPAAGYAGLAYVGGVGIHIANGYYGLSVLVHEFGHNLGLPHAHTWDTGDNSIIGDGSNVEYGNGHDPMGSGNEAMHYVASYKAHLDWIPADECPRIVTAGIYRLHVCDEPRNSNGLRGLRVARNGSLDYWFDFRQNIGGTEFDNGLLLHWANTDGNESYRTDALPKQAGITLPVGMTFSDKTAGVHVTPLRVVSGSFPRAMDVAVGFNVAGNHAPVARLIQYSPQVASGALATWSVEATDADGDTLAYYWDFGDDTHSWDNQPVQSKSFGDGEFAIHCVVSDTRGGVWRKTVVQKSGTPPAAQVRISGRVVDGDSKPLPGIRVSTDGSLYAWSDSVGSYALCRVPKGVHAVAAMDVVENKLSFSRTFSSGTDWQANATGADLSLTETSPEVSTTLVAKLATWKYNDTGTDLGTAWRATAYDDTAWPQGPGFLGYGNGGEGTIISYGGDPANKRTTAYFRKKFTVADPNAFTEIRLRVDRDDAVMVYLNGTRIFLNNFATDITEANITYATHAADTTEPGTYLQQNGISKSLLVAGDNWLCAEVHQVEPTSSDLAFDAELLGISAAPTPGAQAAYLTSPEPGTLIPSGTASVTLTAEARARTATVTKVEFFADSVKLGESATAPYSFTWNSPANGAHTLSVVATFNIGTPLTSGTVNVTVGTPPVTLISAGSVWKWRANTAAPPSNWTAADFDDGAWSSGPAQLGYGDGDEATNISPGGTKYQQVQFRRTFAIADPLAVSAMICHLVRDDAAVVYVNGTLAFRHNFAADGTTPQAAGPDENGWQQSPLNAALLRPGLNTIAVEIYQDSPASSDVSFDLALEGTPGTARARGVYLPAPAPAILPVAPVLAVEALPGASLSVTKIEFFAGLTKIGEDTSYPFAFTWSAALAGTYSITAIATDTAGGAFTGAAVSLTVRQPAQATTIVKQGDTWKYWDNGTDPGSNWIGRTSFDDTAWPEGPARFGYGGDGEVTSLFVSDAAAKPPACYFRKKFIVTDPAAYDALRLRVIRDDGVSVQINRVELLRDNLPAGTLTFSTLATAGALDEQTPVEIIVPTTSLRAGENQLTAEVHQFAVNSSDLSFDLELVGLKSPAPAAPSVWLTSPAAGETILSDDPLPCNIASASLTSAIQRVDYYAGSAKFGEATAAPWSLSWPSALKGTYAVTARALLASGSTLTTAPVTVTITSPTVTQDLIWSGSDWKYLDTGTAPAAPWTTATFDDAAWKTGRSRLGFGGDGETTGVTPGYPIYWFRKPFTVPAGITLTGANLRVIRDDSIQLYLNGTRIWLNNLVDNATPADFATAGISSADEQTWNTVPLSLSALQPGNNLFAAEIRQSSLASSDISFDLALTIHWLTPGGLTNSAPAFVPIATLLRTGPAGFNFTLPETAGRIYSIESSFNLNAWNTESTHITGATGLSVPFPFIGARKYYRARWKSTP